MNRRTLARWSGYAAIAIAFALLCALLSNWQFARSAERDAQLALVAQNFDAAPVPVADLLPEDGIFRERDQWRPVTLTGQYDVAEQLLVRNRPHGGTSTFEVLTPLRLDDGRTFIVNRGWVRPGVEQANPDVVPEPPTGEVTVVARLQPTEPLPRSGRGADEGQVPTIHLPTVADAVGGDVIETAYGWLVSEDPAPVSLPYAMEDPSEDPGPHLSYAIQWILFAIMGFVFIWYMIRAERKARREEAEGISPLATPARRDRDSDEEDALIDAAS